MSLTRFMEMKDVIERVKLLRPKSSRKVGAALRAEPRSSRYTLVGTAFDYLLRFEIQRRVPHAETRPWVAESTADKIWRKTAKGTVSWDILRDTPDPKYYLPPEEVAKRARATVENAKATLAAYLETQTPEREQLIELATYAVRLAKLDSVYRSRQLEARFEEADTNDIEDLLSMLQIVPFDSLLGSGTVRLNPDFGESSSLVGGADTDLIAGDRLVDFKTTKKGTIEVRDLDQLLGYFFLARRQRRVDAKFPAIKRAGLYFCRHGFLWELDAAHWTECPEFSEVEEWFFRRCEEVIRPKSGRKH